VLKISWSPGHDSNVLVPFWELYALAHTIQRNDTYDGEDNPGAIASEWRELAQSVRRSDDHDKKGGHPERIRSDAVEGIIPQIWDNPMNMGFP
jgi:hypothetical protein